MARQTHSDALRTFTVSSAGVALAMLKGKKPVENRSQNWWPLGWYLLHVGREPGHVKPDWQQALQLTWPDVPNESTLPHSCIVGKLRFGRIVRGDTLNHPWVLASSGNWCYIIEESIEFAEPILDIKGNQCVWYMKNGAAIEHIAAATAAGMHRNFPDVFTGVVSDLAHHSSPQTRRTCLRPFSKRMPRKPRQNANTSVQAAPTPSTPRGLSRSGLGPDGCRVTSRKRKRKTSVEAHRHAKAPAFHEPAVEDTGLPASQDVRSVGEFCTLASRFRAGRTLPRLLQIMQQHVFHRPSPVRDEDQSLTPQPGLFAMWQGGSVFIVGVFIRRRIPLADVVKLLPRTQADSRELFVARLADAHTVPQSEVSDVGAHFRIVTHNKRISRTSIWFARVIRQPGSDFQQSLQLCAFANVWGCASRNTSTNERRICERLRSITNKHIVQPRALQEHIDEMAARGENHKGVPRCELQRVIHILDYPLPIAVDVTTQRCGVCRNRHHDATYAVTDADIRAAYPDIMVWRDPLYRNRPIYMTRVFLMELVTLFVRHLNARACRRSLADTYAATCLGFQLGGAGLSLLMAVPPVDAIRAVVARALENFLPIAVKNMQRHVHVYAGTMMRSDANWEIAHRIFVPGPDGTGKVFPFTALFAWLGVDCALLQPCTPQKKEDITLLLQDLDPLVDEMKEHRISSGLSYTESTVAVHCTDTYGRHRLKLRAFYNRKYADGGASVVTSTPKSDASAAVGDAAASFTTITGDAFHDVIAFRKTVPPTANDARDLIYDYQHMISRLSAKRPVQRPDRVSMPMSLPQAAHALLKAAVQQPSSVYGHTLRNDTDGAALLRTFLQQANVDAAATWKELFGSHPPRGVVARIARRSGVSLHSTLAYENYRTLKQFLREARRVRRWYLKGRRLSRRRRGIVRDGPALDQVPGLKRAWSKKSEAHYKRLCKKLRLEGFWAWRDAALALHAAGVPVHSGTVPVERFWACLKQMLPAGSRCMSLRWFNILSSLCFLRYNYMLYNKMSLPTWCDKDNVLAQRLETVIMLTQAIQDADDEAIAHLQPIFDAFM